MADTGRQAHHGDGVSGQRVEHPPSGGRAADQTDERTPLLSNHDGTPSKQAETEKQLPYGQIFLLCFSRMVEPVAFFSIFPFINQMVFETGVDATQTGFWTGLIESLFSLTQFIVMPFWGRYSDRRGRKPILIVSLLGLAITSTLFGLSRNVTQMVIFRCLSGVCSGSVVTIRTMISENSTAKTQARAFSLFAFAGNLAILLGPLMGGTLSKPADHFKPFSHLQLFRDFPYILPCMVTGSLSLIAAITNILFLRETLQSQDTGAGKQAVQAPTTKDILRAEGVRPVLALYWATLTLGFMYTALVPVFWFTPITFGGYGLTPSQISYLLAVGGCGQAFWTLVVFPPLTKRVGHVGILRAVVFAWVALFVVLPSINLLRRQGISDAVFWTLGVIVAMFGSGISMSYTTIQLTLNDISPSPAALGTLNGIALSGSAAVRAISPAIITSIYAVGVDRQILKGQLAFLVLLVLTAGYALVVSQLPKKAYGLDAAELARPPSVDEESS